jgi:hypothetical protein
MSITFRKIKMKHYEYALAVIVWVGVAYGIKILFDLSTTTHYICDFECQQNTISDLEYLRKVEKEIIFGDN